MPFRTLPFPVALLLSLLLHAGLFALLISGIAPNDFLGGGPSPMLVARSDAPTAPPEIEMIQLGLEDSDADTRSWLGYRDDPQEQRAPRSEIEQAAFDKDPAGGAAGQDPLAESPQSLPGEMARPVEPVPASAPSPPSEPSEPGQQSQPLLDPGPEQPTSPSPPKETPVAEESPPQSAPAPEPKAPPDSTPPREPMEDPSRPLTLPSLEEAVEPPVDEEAARRLAEIAEFVESLLPSRRLLERWTPAVRDESGESEPREQEPSRDPAAERPAGTGADQRPPAQEQPEEGARESQPATPSAPGPPRQRKADGDTADRESDATSTVDVPPEQWRRGRPVAARGLDIKTRRPVFPELTSLTARPINPVIEVFFDRNGVPRRAGIVRSSGDPRVDGPLVDALYRWRASGEPLRQLQGEELFRIELRILLGDG